MFSLGTGAAIKHSVDITSEFALLPDATITTDQSIEDMDDLGHASHTATPIPTNNREKASKAVMAEEPFFDELAKSDVENLDLDRESDHADVPEGAVLSPEESAAIADMKRLKTALESASSYGGGVNAKGKQARFRSDSKRPSDVLPEAWSDMSQVAKDKVEIEYGAKRTLLRRQIAELKAKHNDLDFENLMRITPAGAVSVIVGPTYSDGWNWYDNDRVQFATTREGMVLLARREAERDHRMYQAISHPMNEQLCIDEQFPTNSHLASKQTCTYRRANNSGAPAVSQQWAAMVHTPADALTDEQNLLLKTVQAEDLFVCGG